MQPPPPPTLSASALPERVEVFGVGDSFGLGTRLDVQLLRWASRVGRFKEDLGEEYVTGLLGRPGRTARVTVPEDEPLVAQLSQLLAFGYLVLGAVSAVALATWDYFPTALIRVPLLVLGSAGFGVFGAQGLTHGIIIQFRATRRSDPNWPAPIVDSTVLFLSLSAGACVRRLVYRTGGVRPPRSP
jgi:hypothetical protein